MSTRACYTFIDADGTTHHVYKHHDGYPSGAAGFIKDAANYAWDFPRFEASDFGAAFIRANKDSGGGVYLTAHYDNHGDLEYRYEIAEASPEPNVTAYSIKGEVKGKSTWKQIWTGPFSRLIELAAVE